MDILDTPAPISLSHALANLIGGIPDDDFYIKLFAFISRNFFFDSGHVIQYDIEGAPTVLHDGRPAPYEPLYEYISGYFLLDPLWTKIENRTFVDKTYNLDTLAPDNFYKSSYYKHHYGEAEIVDEIGWVVSLSETIRIVVCLMRRWDSECFSKADLDFMAVVQPIVSSAVTVHEHLKQQRADRSNAIRAGKYLSPSEFINRLIRTRGEEGSQLSERQSEVVNLILKGHSTESIALNLEISAGTVKTHKRDIYSKLNISSHGELFNVFVEAMYGGEPNLAPSIAARQS